MPRGIYKRKKKAGRPKGSRNKLMTSVDFDEMISRGSIPTEPPSYLSRLEAATVKYEQAVNDAITALKGS